MIDINPDRVNTVIVYCSRERSRIIGMGLKSAVVSHELALRVRRSTVTPYLDVGPRCQIK